MQSVIDTVSSILPTTDSSTGGLSQGQKEANLKEAFKGEINPPKVPEAEEYEGSNTGLSSVSASTSLEQGIHGNPGGGNSFGAEEGSDVAQSSTELASGPETSIYTQSAPTAIEQGVRGAPGGGNKLPDDSTAEENLNGDVMPVN